MKFTANNQSEYTHYQVNEELPLLEWLLKNINQSRSKLKATLQGNGIKVEGKTVTQYDYPLKKGMPGQGRPLSSGWRPRTPPGMRRTAASWFSRRTPGHG